MSIVAPSGSAALLRVRNSWPRAQTRTVPHLRIVFHNPPGPKFSTADSVPTQFRVFAEFAPAVD